MSQDIFGDMMSVTFNGDNILVPRGCTLGELLKAHDIPERGIAIAVNGEIVPKTTRGDVVVLPEMRIEVVTVAQGG